MLSLERHSGFQSRSQPEESDISEVWIEERNEGLGNWLFGVGWEHAVAWLVSEKILIPEGEGRERTPSISERHPFHIFTLDFN